VASSFSSPQGLSIAGSLSSQRQFVKDACDSKIAMGLPKGSVLGLTAERNNQANECKFTTNSRTPDAGCLELCAGPDRRGGGATRRLRTTERGTPQRNPARSGNGRLDSWTDGNLERPGWPSAVDRDGDRYALTPESAAFLVPSRPGYHGMFFQHISDHLLPRWLELNEIVRTGRPASHVNQEEEGAEFFAAFVESLFPISFPAANALGEHLGVPGATAPVSVLDIGAGSGVWGIALAKQSPQVRIRAVDWPRVLEVTQRVAAQHGVADRLTVAPGEFFEADFGAGHQVATVGHILHSEGRDRSRRLLKKTWSALAPGGTIAIQEFVPNDERTGPLHTLIFA
jgi:hypothetical protein